MQRPSKLPSISLLTEQENKEHLALLNAIIKGDEKAMNVLYRKLSRRIYAFALRRLSTPQVAEEVVVETMFEVWKNADRFAGQSKVSTWILGIARYKILDKMRQKGLKGMQEIDEETNAIKDPSPSAFEQIAEKQEAKHVSQCLETLPDDQRECMHLVFFEELGLADIAEIQQCPENTIKTRMFHARRKMRECIEKQLSWSKNT